MTFKALLIGAALATALTAGACGTTPGDRAVSGGLIGAGAGAAIAGVTGGSVGTGAAIGAAAGAITGAVSDPCTLNFGDPYWNSRSRQEYEDRCGRR